MKPTHPQNVKNPITKQDDSDSDNITPTSPPFHVRTELVHPNDGVMHTPSDSERSGSTTDSIDDFELRDFPNDLSLGDGRKFSLQETSILKPKFVSESEVKRMISDVKRVYVKQIHELQDEILRYETLIKLEGAKYQSDHLYVSKEKIPVTGEPVDYRSLYLDAIKQNIELKDVISDLEKKLSK